MLPLYKHNIPSIINVILIEQTTAIQLKQLTVSIAKCHSKRVHKEYYCCTVKLIRAFESLVFNISIIIWYIYNLSPLLFLCLHSFLQGFSSVITSYQESESTTDQNGWSNNCNMHWTNHTTTCHSTTYPHCTVYMYALDTLYFQSDLIIAEVSTSSSSVRFLRAGCLSWHPTNSVKALKGWLMRCWHGYLLVQSANRLHMVQLMPLPPRHVCFRKIQNGLSFLVQTHLYSPLVPDKGS